jgi:hypothetical protein
LGDGKAVISERDYIPGRGYNCWLNVIDLQTQAVDSIFLASESVSANSDFTFAVPIAIAGNRIFATVNSENGSKTYVFELSDYRNVAEIPLPGFCYELKAGNNNQLLAFYELKLATIDAQSLEVLNTLTIRESHSPASSRQTLDPTNGMIYFLDNNLVKRYDPLSHEVAIIGRYPAGTSIIFDKKNRLIVLGDGRQTTLIDTEGRLFAQMPVSGELYGIVSD